MSPDNLFLVVESTATVRGCGEVGNNKTNCDHKRWKDRGIKVLYCIAPPDHGKFQAYLLSQAHECHYEEFSHRLLAAIRYTTMEIRFFPAGGINTKDNFLYVINNENALKPFSSFLSVSQTSMMMKRHVNRTANSSIQRPSPSSNVCDFGCSSMFICETHAIFPTFFLIIFLFFDAGATQANVFIVSSSYLFLL